MRDMFNRLLGLDKGSKEDAKARLKFLLVHDQVDLTPVQLESMKTEIIEVVSRYVEIDRTAAEFKLEKDRAGEERERAREWRGDEEEEVDWKDRESS